MSPPKLLELRPNRDQLDPNFNGYKLSLEKIPIIKETLNAQVDRVLPSDDQYSFLHAKLFGLHNHLTGETIGDSASVYFVDKSWHVQKAYLDEFSGMVTLFKVWEVPTSKARSGGDYNFSLKFASNNLVVVSDGTGMLYVLDTGSRYDNIEWQCVFCDEAIGPEKKFIIQDVVCIENKLHCLLFSVEQDDSSKKYSAVLHWITLLQAEDKSWGAVALRELKSKGDLYYAYLEPTCTAIYTVTDSGCKFTVDSENPIVNKSQPESANKKYEWVQTYEDITLKFELPEGFKKDDIRVNVQANEINVYYKDAVLLKGKFTHRINADVTAWTTTNNMLEIVLTKEEVGLMWSEVIEDDQTGEHCLDPNVVEEAHQKLEHLCSEAEVTEAQCENGPLFSRQQIEECDFEDDKLAVFERLCCNSHEVTHRSNLGSQHVLLTTKLSEELPPAMAIRYDVDACLWQPLGSGDNFSLKHEATLLAFGYIQASKQQKKFCACAPDVSYSVICESSRHIFIYRQNKSIGNAELRNRTSGRRFGTIAQQQVVNIVDEEIVGLYAANSLLFLLTENSIITLQL